MSTCSDSKSLDNLRKIQDFFMRSQFRSDIQLSHKLIEMYVKCGSMSDARRVFDRMPERNLDSWHLMMCG